MSRRRMMFVPAVQRQFLHCVKPLWLKCLTWNSCPSPVVAQLTALNGMKYGVITPRTRVIISSLYYIYIHPENRYHVWNKLINIHVLLFLSILVKKLDMATFPVAPWSASREVKWKEAPSLDASQVALGGNPPQCGILRGSSGFLPCTMVYPTS
jgi:hypothetical protein